MSPSSGLGVTERQRESALAGILMVIIAAVFIMLRFVARKMRGMRLEWDDWMEIVSLITLVILLICFLLLVQTGVGLHFTDITSVAQEEKLLKIMMAYEGAYVLAILAVKTCLLLMYNRMFPTPQIRNASFLLWIITALLTFSIVVVTIFQCTPISRTWDPLVEGKCLDERAVLIYTALPNVLTDFAILSLPIRLVWSMEIRLDQKYILTLVFSSGCLFIIGSVARFIILFEFQKSDFPYTILRPALWSVIEVCLGVITGCIPTLAPLFQFAASKFHSSLSKTENATELVYQCNTSSEQVLSPSCFSLDSSDIRNPKKMQKATVKPLHKSSDSTGSFIPHFRRKESTRRLTEMGVNILEVKVTTTVDVIVSILSNDGPGPAPRMLRSDQVEMQMWEEERGGFRHEYGPRAMRGWI